MSWPWPLSPPPLSCTAPAAATPKALQRAGLQQSDVDYWEINQAFSVVDLVNQKLLGLQPDRVNVHGGAVALGESPGSVACYVDLVGLCLCWAVALCPFGC
jgi:acetyl-CoA C-acetyltransferase